MMHLCAIRAVLQFAQRIAAGFESLSRYQSYNFARQTAILHDLALIMVALGRRARLSGID